VGVTLARAALVRVALGRAALEVAVGGTPVAMFTRVGVRVGVAAAGGPRVPPFAFGALAVRVAKILAATCVSIKVVSPVGCKVGVRVALGPHAISANSINTKANDLNFILAPENNLTPVYYDIGKTQAE
jgi:hypothetical protein